MNIINKKYKISYILSTISLIFFDTIGFIIPILIGSLVDTITLEDNYNKLLFITLFIIIFTLIKFLGSYLSVIKLNVTCFNIIKELKEKCYKNINNLDSYFFLNHNKGELMTNFTEDMNTIRHHIAFNIKTIGAILLTFLCSFIYLMTINICFTLILLTPGIIIGISTYKFIKKISPEYENLRDLTAHYNAFVSDNIEGNRVVKSYAIELSEIKKADKLMSKLIKEETNTSLKEIKFYSKVDFLSHLMLVIFLILGGYLFINDNITLGSLIIFNSYLYNLRAPFIRMSGLLNSIERYKVSKKRIEKLLEEQPKIKLNGTKPLENLFVPIEFKNVRIVYDEKVVLENLNLKINPGETVAFIGKTGSGKTSIVNLLLGFVIPESGEVLINNENYLNYNIKDIRKRIGYVTQNAFLFSDTIYNNISYGNESLTKNVANHFASIACASFIDKLPNKIDTIIGEKGARLSGGEKQRVSLARALAVNPDILLLDDITSALDIETESKINESIKTLDYKKTKIIIASKIVSVKSCDKIYVLDKGSIIEEGTHLELLAKKGYYYDLYCTEKGGI